MGGASRSCSQSLRVPKCGAARHVQVVLVQRVIRLARSQDASELRHGRLEGSGADAETLDEVGKPAAVFGGEPLGVALQVLQRHGLAAAGGRGGERAHQLPNVAPGDRLDVAGEISDQTAELAIRGYAMGHDKVLAGAVEGDQPGGVLSADGLELDSDTRQVKRDGNVIALRPKEFELLAYLMRNPSIVLSRDRLLERVWGYDYTGDTRTVDVHVRWLREKIEADPGRPKLLITVRGAGYRFEA